MPGVIDASQRIRALDYRTSFAVTAPAGSGKTELLIQRTLTLLAHVEMPEEVLAITFTRKAANEMRSRILAALQEGQSATPPTETHKLTTWNLSRAVLAQDQRYNWSLLDNPNRLRIKTIDSFCMHLVQRMPLLSKLGADAGINNDAQSQYQQAARQLLAHLEQDNHIGHDLQLLLGHLDNNTARIETLLCSILSKREQWLRHFMLGRQAEFDFQAYLENCLEELVEETLIQTTQLLSGFAPALGDVMDFACRQLAELNPDAELLMCDGLHGLPEPSCDSLPQWQAMTGLVLKKDGAFRARLTKNEGFPAATAKADKEKFKAAKEQCLELIAELADCPGVLEQLQEIRHLPLPYYDHKQWQLLDTLTRLLPTLVAELSLVFMEHGQVDYSQISIAALTALGDEDQPSDIALLLDYQLKHILVDEFQDTSAGQFNLLARLTEGWEAEDGRTLFIVGDGMQSCYGFREANVGLFLAAREFGIGNAALEAIDLRVNFRSDSGIVNWVNQAFSEAFPAQDNIARGAVSYSPSVAFHEGVEQKPVQFFGCIEQQTRNIEAAQVTQLIQQTLVSHPDDSIAILVRNRSHLQDIIPALREANIRWSAVDIDPLAQRPLISDLMALTQALLNPADSVSWLAILRAPWCGLSLADLHRLAKTDASVETQPKVNLNVWQRLCSEQHLSSLSDTGKISVNRLITNLKQAIQARYRKPLRQWIEGVWLSLGGPLTASSEQELAQVPAFFELLNAHESAGSLRDMDAFKTAVSRLYSLPETCPDIRVHIMTIHKSKGLEFDHVLIPGLDRTNRPASQELLLWHERLSAAGEPLLLMGSIPEKTALKSANAAEDDALYKYLNREHRLKAQLENTRLLYVGATRAVKRLVLLANVQKNEKTDDLKAPSENSLLRSLWAQISRDVQLLEAATQPAPQSLSALEHQLPANTLTRLPCNWQPPIYPRCDLLAEYRGHEYHDRNNNNLQESLSESGTALDSERINNCLQQLLFALCELGSEYWLDAAPGALNNLIRVHTLQNGLNPEQPVLTDDIQLMIQKVLQETQGQWLLSANHENARNNWQLNQRLPNGDVSQLSIKRSFMVDQQHWLIDFDFSTEFDEQQISPNKVAQLQPAITALSALSTLPVKAAVYFVRNDPPRLIKLS